MRKVRDIEKMDIQAVMNTENGRRLVYRMLVRAGLYQTSYDPEAPEKNIFFKEGQRNMGLWLLSELQDAAPDSYLLMMKESRNVVTDIKK